MLKSCGSYGQALKGARGNCRAWFSSSLLEPAPQEEAIVYDQKDWNKFEDRELKVPLKPLNVNRQESMYRYLSAQEQLGHEKKSWNIFEDRELKVHLKALDVHEEDPTYSLGSRSSNKAPAHSLLELMQLHANAQEPAPQEEALVYDKKDWNKFEDRELKMPLKPLDVTRQMYHYLSAQSSLKVAKAKAMKAY